MTTTQTTTVESLAGAKRLDPGWLREQGVEDLPGGGVSIAYRDLGGGELFRRRRGVGGERFLNQKGAALRPYGLWKLDEFDAVTDLYLTEGESDAWPLWMIGKAAVGIPGATQAGCLELADLAGAKDVYLCLDTTPCKPGRPDVDAQFRDAVLARLEAVGWSGTVHVVRMPPGFKDVSEVWVESADPDAFAAALARQCGQAKQVFVGEKAKEEPTPVLVRLSDVAAERTTWLWDGWLPFGCLAVLDGDPGLGKSSLTLDLAARLSRGLALPPLEGKDLGRGPAATLLMGAEDSLAHTVRPRLDAMGADCSLIYSYEAVRLAADDERPVTLPRDLERVAAFVESANVKLVVIDPLMAFLSSETDAHKDQDVRRCLRPMHRLAERLGIVVLLVRHLNKLSGGPALYRGGSSIGITGAGRASLIVGRDPGSERRYVLAMNKINVAANPPSLAYRIEAAGLACRVVWEGEVDLWPDQILGHGRPASGEPGQQPRRGGKASDVLGDARRFLADLLCGGAVPTKDVEAAAETHGQAWRTLARAKADMGVRSVKRDAVWYWELPQKSNDAKSANMPMGPGESGTDDSGTLDENTSENDDDDFLPFA